MMLSIKGNNVVLNLANLYLQDTKMTFMLPGALDTRHYDGFQYLYTGASSIDLINFGGNISLELMRLSHSWQETVRGVRLKSLVVLLGAGGVILYLLRRSRQSPDPWPWQGFLDWLLAEELVEDPTSFYDYHQLSSYYFGPEMGLAQTSSSDSEDLSLNSLSNKSSPVKFLRAPLYDLSPVGLSSILQHYKTPGGGAVAGCRRCARGSCRLKRHQQPPGSSSSSSCYSGSPALRVKTSTPDTEADLVLQRTVASNRLTFRNFVPGQDLRMRGDGCEGESYILSRDTSLSSFADLSRSNSISSSMMDIVMGARQVRRFIREISLDSQESDIDIDNDYKENNNNYSQQLGDICDSINKIMDNSEEITSDITGEEYRDSDDEPRLKKENSVPDFKLIERKTGINRRLWKLTGFSDRESLNMSEYSDGDNASLEWDSPAHAWDSPSLLSPSVSVRQEGLEWDNEFSTNSVHSEEVAEYSKLWLRDLEFSSQTPLSQYLSRSSSRRSSTDTEVKYMTRYPPSGRSSVGGSEEEAWAGPGSKYRSRSGSFHKSRSASPETESFAKNIMNSSLTSQESGFQDCENSMTSSMSSSVCSVNNSLISSYHPSQLSPVKEDKEPRSPMKVKSPGTVTSYGERSTATLTDSELLIVTEDQDQDN